MVAGLGQNRSLDGRGGSDSQAQQEAGRLQRAVAPGLVDILVSVTAC